MGLVSLVKIYAKLVVMEPVVIPVWNQILLE